MSNTPTALGFDAPRNVSGLTADVWSPDIAALDNGRTAVVWTHGRNSGILLRLYDASGAPEGQAIRVTSPDEEGNRPSVDLLENGHFIVTYTSLPSGPRSEIRAQTFDTTGGKLGGSNLFFTDFVAVAPDTAALAGGGSVTVFTAYDVDRFGVFAQRTDGQGNPEGDAFRINQTQSGFQSGGDVVALPDGGFLVVWRARDLDGSVYAVAKRAYDADGTPREGE